MAVGLATPLCEMCKGMFDDVERAKGADQSGWNVN